MVRGRRNHPSIVQWDVFNECNPKAQTVADAVALVRALDPTRPVNAISGINYHGATPPSVTGDVQDFHTDSISCPRRTPAFSRPSAKRTCGCSPSLHTWFHDLPTSKALFRDPWCGL